MTTLPLRALHAPQAWSFPSLARFGNYVSLLLEAYHEAQIKTSAARRKYPFADV